MLHTIEDFLSSPWIGLLVALVGIGVAIIIYFRTKRAPSLAYSQESTTLIGMTGTPPSDSIAILYEGTSVSRVTSSRVIIWNNGNTVLRNSDVVEDDPLRIELVDKGSILDIRKIQSLWMSMIYKSIKTKLVIQELFPSFFLIGMMEQVLRCYIPELQEGYRSQER